MEIHDIGLESILNADWIPGSLTPFPLFSPPCRASPAVRGRERARRCQVTVSIRKKWLTVPIDNERHFSSCWNVRPVRENFMRNKGYHLTRLRIKDIARRERDNMMLDNTYHTLFLHKFITQEYSLFIHIVQSRERIVEIFFYHLSAKHICQMNRSDKKKNFIYKNIVSL